MENHNEIYHDDVEDTDFLNSFADLIIYLNSRKRCKRCKRYVVQLLRITDISGIVYQLTIGTAKSAYSAYICNDEPTRREKIMYARLSNSVDIRACLERFIQFTYDRSDMRYSDLTYYFRYIVNCDLECYEDFWRVHSDDDSCIEKILLADIAELVKGIAIDPSSLKQIAYDSIRHDIPAIKIADESYTNLLDRIRDDILSD